MSKKSKESNVVGISELARFVAASSSVTIETAEDCIKSLIMTMQSALSQGYRVQLTGFGSFEAKMRAARVARNINTGETIKVKQQKRPVFSPSDQLCEEIK